MGLSLDSTVIYYLHIVNTKLLVMNDKFLNFTSQKARSWIFKMKIYPRQFYGWEINS